LDDPGITEGEERAGEVDERTAPAGGISGSRSNRRAWVPPDSVFVPGAGRPSRIGVAHDVRRCPVLPAGQKCFGRVDIIINSSGRNAIKSRGVVFLAVERGLTDPGPGAHNVY